MALSTFLRTRRGILLFVASDVIIVGLIIHFFIPGHLANLVSDALYTVLVYLGLAVLLPRAQRVWLALAAFGFSALIELSQLTGVPEQLAVSFPPSRLIFGTTFSALDLLAYAVGAAVAYLGDRFISERAATLRVTQPE